MNKHRQLVAWQCCHELTREIYLVTRAFPLHERYGLSQQLRRAAVSAGANIAEGSARYGRAEFAHGLSIALGSLAEVDSLLAIAEDLGYVAGDDRERIESLRARASRATYRLQRSMR